MARLRPFSSDIEHSPRSFRFLDLPVELRLMVYEYMSQDVVKCTMRLDQATINYHQISPAITQTSSFIREESYNKLQTMQIQIVPTLLADLDLPHGKALLSDKNMWTLIEITKIFLAGYSDYVERHPDVRIPTDYYKFLCEAVLVRSNKPHTCHAFAEISSSALADFYCKTILRMQHIGRLEIQFRIHLPRNQQPGIDVFGYLFRIERMLTGYNPAGFPLVVVLIVDREHVSFFEHACTPPPVMTGEQARSKFVVRAAHGAGEDNLSIIY